MTLAGKRIVNTRAVDQAARLNDLLYAHGAIPLDYPAIAIVPPENTRALDQALEGAYDLLVLTSANSVEILAQRTQALGLSLRGISAAVVGTATAQAAREKLGVEIVLIPDEPNAEA
ncbi:MAG: uroporphyrinogen-III synthase, partial [Chloroflexota bacterium]